MRLYGLHLCGLLCLGWATGLLGQPMDIPLTVYPIDVNAPMISRDRCVLLRTQTAGPSTVDLPAFVDPDPIFAQWSTPRVQAGFVWLALDRTRPDGPWDRLYVDCDADGSLADEGGLAMQEATTQRDLVITYHPFVTIRFQDSAAYSLCCMAVCRRQACVLRLESRVRFTGEPILDGVRSSLVLEDATVNGCFDDPNDMLRINAASGLDDHALRTTYLQCGKALYRVSAARDGSHLSLVQAKDVVHGQVRVPEGVARLCLDGPTGRFTAEPNEQVALFPAGAYDAIDSWLAVHTDERGSHWEMKGARSRYAMEVEPNRPVVLDLGRSVVSRLHAGRDAGGGIYIRHRLTDAYGGSVEITCKGQLTPPPTLMIRSQDGSYEQLYALKYG